jgi:hypothetical protein
VAKAAYHQVEAMEEDIRHKIGDDGNDEDDDEDKTNSRDVGHNIYILAHQVLQEFISCVKISKSCDNVPQSCMSRMFLFTAQTTYAANLSNPGS